MLWTKLIFYLVFCVWTGNGSPNLLSTSASYDVDEDPCAGFVNRFDAFFDVIETLENGEVCNMEKGTISKANFTGIEFVSNDVDQNCQKYFSISLNETEASIIIKESLNEVFDEEKLVKIGACSINYTCIDGTTYRDNSVLFTIQPENDNAPFFWDNNTAVVNISKLFTPGIPIPELNIIAQDLDFVPPNKDNEDNVILCEVPGDPGDLIGCTTTKKDDGVYEFSLFLKRAIDAGDKNPFIFNLTAYDNGMESLPGNNTQEVTINFEATDQSPPAFDKLYYHGEISNPEWDDTPHELVTITATDPDVEINSDIMYSIDQEELAKICTNECFKIDAISGVLSWSNVLDDTVIKSRLVEVLVTATEDSELKKSNTTVVIITITGDENPPKFGKEIYQGNIDAHGNMAGISFTVSDADTAIAQTPEFRLIGEADHIGYFEIKEGTVALEEGFDISSNNLPFGGRVSFNLEVVDKDDTTKMDRSLVIVTYPWNKKNPKFTASSLKGNVSSGEVVSLDNKLSAVDEDDVKSEIEYELLDPAGTGEFTLDTTTPNDVKIQFTGQATPYRHVTLIVKASEKNPKDGIDSRMDVATVFVTVGEEIKLSTPQPTDQPTEHPTDQPTDQPTDHPTDQPTDKPTDQPTDQPTDSPTTTNTECPTCEPPTPCPSTSTTIFSTSEPTDSPTSSSCPTPTPCPTTTPAPTCPPPTPCPNITTPATTTPDCTPCPTSFSTPPVTSTSTGSTTTNSVPGDETVKFISGDEQASVQNVGYPSFVMLENSVPMPITRVVASCTNTAYNGQITYDIPVATSKFHVHKTTGEVFANNAVDQLKLTDVCSSTCSVQVRATLVTQTGDKTDQITVKVTALDQNQLAVFSSQKSASDAETVVEKINNNNNASVWFRLVNTQPSETSQRSGTDQRSRTGQGSRTGQRSRTGQGSLLFLTARKGEIFINKNEAAEIIASMEDMDVVEDPDIDVYHPTPPPPSDGGLVAAVVVLGVLLACIPLAVLAFFAYKKRSSILNRLPTRNNASKMDKMSDAGDGYEDMNYFNSDDMDKEKTMASNNKPKMGQPALGKANHGLMREMSTELERRLETKQSNTATPSAETTSRTLPPAASSKSVGRTLNTPSANSASNPVEEARQLQFIKPPQKKKAPAAPPSVQPADGVRFNEKAEVVEVDKDGDKASIAGSVSSVTSNSSESSSEASTSSDDEDVTVM